MTEFSLFSVSMLEIIILKKLMSGRECKTLQDSKHNHFTLDFFVSVTFGLVLNTSGHHVKLALIVQR